jgi:hypothetical protein
MNSSSAGRAYGNFKNVKLWNYVRCTERNEHNKKEYEEGWNIVTSIT